VLLIYLLPAFPHFYNHQMVMSIIVSCPERPYIEYTRMSSPLYQYLINLVVTLPIRRGPLVFKNVLKQELCALNNEIFWCGKVYYSNTIIITIRMWTLIPNHLKKSSLSSFALKSPNRIFIWYLGKLPKSPLICRSLSKLTICYVFKIISGAYNLIQAF